MCPTKKMSPILSSLSLVSLSLWSDGRSLSPSGTVDEIKNRVGKRTAMTFCIDYWIQKDTSQGYFCLWWCLMRILTEEKERKAERKKSSTNFSPWLLFSSLFYVFTAFLLLEKRRCACPCWVVDIRNQERLVLHRSLSNEKHHASLGSLQPLQLLNDFTMTNRTLDMSVLDKILSLNGRRTYNWFGSRCTTLERRLSGDSDRHPSHREKEEEEASALFSFMINLLYRPSDSLDKASLLSRERAMLAEGVRTRTKDLISVFSLLVPPWATIIVIIIVLLTLCTCLVCCVRRMCRKIWKKKGVKGGKGIDLQAVKSFGLHKEKVRLRVHRAIDHRKMSLSRFNRMSKNWHRTWKIMKMPIRRRVKHRIWVNSSIHWITTFKNRR